MKKPEPLFVFHRVKCKTCGHTWLYEGDGVPKCPKRHAWTLTDAKVAKALGWKRMGSRKIGSVIKPIKHRGWWTPKGELFDIFTPPPFTTSIDMIVGEIEARGLGPQSKNSPGWSVNVAYHGKKGAGYRAHLAFGAVEGWSSRHPAEALCAALLEYLKAKS